MKKSASFNTLTLVLFIIILTFSLILISAQDNNTNNKDTENDNDLKAPEVKDNYEEIQKNIKEIPLDKDGKLNETKLNSSFFFFSSKAEQRIIKINEWIEDNVSWLGLVFGMTPEISLTFFLVIFLMVIALTHLVINAHKIWIFIDNPNLQIVFGAAVFLILLVIRAYVVIATVISDAFFYFYRTILPWGIWIASLIIIATFVIFLALLIFAPQLLTIILRVFAKLTGKKIASNAIDKVAAKGEEEVQKLKEVREIEEAFVKGAGFG